MNILSKRFVSIACGASLTIALVGCGGGGSSAVSTAVSSPTPATSVAQTYNLSAAWAAYWASTTTLTGSIVASQNGQTGTATYREDRSALVAATFEGQAAFRKTVVGTITPTTGNPISVTEDQYFDANSNLLGASGSLTGYSVVTYRPMIPTAVKVGDSGTWYSAIGYTNSIKTSTSGVGTQNYSIQADAADSVLFIVTEAAGTSTKVTTFRLTQASVLKKLKIQSTTSSLSSTITFD